MRPDDTLITYGNPGFARSYVFILVYIMNLVFESVTSKTQNKIYLLVKYHNILTTIWFQLVSRPNWSRHCRLRRKGTGFSPKGTEIWVTF